MIFRIAVLHHGDATSPGLRRLAAGLAAHGLSAGRDYAVDAAGAGGQWAVLPALAEQLLGHRPDVLVAIGGLAALAAKRATSRTPILYAIVLDPEEIDLIAPNLSGVSTFDPDQALRHAQLLRNLVPGLRRVICLADGSAPLGRSGRNPLLAGAVHAASECEFELPWVDLAAAGLKAEAALEAAKRSGAQAVLALEVPAVLLKLGQVARIAEHLRLPTLLPSGWPQAGILMQGAALHDALAPLAGHVAAIARGNQIRCLPVRFVRNDRLVLHRGLARRIGVDIPKSLLAQATECVDHCACCLPVAGGSVQAHVTPSTNDRDFTWGLT